MKKILLASTALVGLAGAASAEIAISGYAELGIGGGDAIETQFINDFTLQFDMTSTTDGGVEFGASAELQSDGSPNPNGNASWDNLNAWVSGSFGKITLGEVDGAFDWALTEVAAGSSIFDEHTTHVGYDGNGFFDGDYDNQQLRYEYSFGDFAAAISAELDDTTGTGHMDPTFQVGVKWKGSMGGMDVGAGLGYVSADGYDVIGVSANAALAAGFKVGLNYSDFEADTGGFASHRFGTLTGGDSGTHVAVGVTYQTGALLLHANYGKYEFDNNPDIDGWGVVANYDLGGGMLATAGYASDVDAATAGDQNQFSAGLALSF